MGLLSLFPRRRYKNLKLDLFAQPTMAGREPNLDAQNQMSAEEFAECLKRLPEGAVYPNAKPGAFVANKPGTSTGPEALPPRPVQASLKEDDSQPRRQNSSETESVERRGVQANRPVAATLRRDLVDRNRQMTPVRKASDKVAKKYDPTPVVPASVQKAWDAMRQAETEADELVSALLKAVY